MATQEAAFKALLTGDATFAALATGGIFLWDDFDNNLGATPQNLDAEGAYNAAGALKPCAVIKFDTETQGNLQKAELRFVRVYLYDENGFGTIRSMKRRLKRKDVLHQVTFTSDNELTNYVEYVDSLPEFTDDALQGAAASAVRLSILSLRSN